MIKVKPTKINEGIIRMDELRPLECGFIADDSSDYNGHFVMRTANEKAIEVMDLTDARPGGWWTVGCDIKVRRLRSDEIVCLEITGDQLVEHKEESFSIDKFKSILQKSRGSHVSVSRPGHGSNINGELKVGPGAFTVNGITFSYGMVKDVYEYPGEDRPILILVK